MGKGIRGFQAHCAPMSLQHMAAQNGGLCRSHEYVDHPNWFGGNVQQAMSGRQSP